MNDQPFTPEELLSIVKAHEELLTVEAYLQDSAWNELHFAAARNNKTAVAAIIAENNLNLRARTRDGKTALHIAAISDSNLSAAKKLIAAAPDLIVSADNDGWTPLHYACLAGKCQKIYSFTDERWYDYNTGGLAMARLLLNNGADRNAQTCHQNLTPLDVVPEDAKKEFQELFDLILAQQLQAEDQRPRPKRSKRIGKQPMISVLSSSDDATSAQDHDE